jgi:hypothetical protein
MVVVVAWYYRKKEKSEEEHRNTEVPTALPVLNAPTSSVDVSVFGGPFVARKDASYDKNWTTPKKPTHTKPSLTNGVWNGQLITVYHILQGTGRTDGDTQFGTARTPDTNERMKISVNRNTGSMPRTPTREWQGATGNE